MAQKKAVVLVLQSDSLWVVLSAKANSDEKIDTFKYNYKYMVLKTNAIDEDNEKS